MAKQGAYKSPKAVTRDRVWEELQKNRRIVESQGVKESQLKEQVKACAEAATKAENKIHELLRAVDKGDPVYELKGGELTLEAPDAQQELPHTGEE